MPLDYLPILAERAALGPPRKLRRAPKAAWQPLDRPLNEMRVSLITSAAIRQSDQRPFSTMGDASHCRITSDPTGAELCIDHRSPVGADARRDPAVVFPRRALLELARKGVIGSVAPGHFSSQPREPQAVAGKRPLPLLGGELQIVGPVLRGRVPEQERAVRAGSRRGRPSGPLPGPTNLAPVNLAGRPGTRRPVPRW